MTQNWKSSSSTSALVKSHFKLDWYKAASGEADRYKQPPGIEYLWSATLTEPQSLFGGPWAAEPARQILIYGLSSFCPQAREALHEE